MDIHRCRFVPYPPSAINSVAFSYPTVSKSQKGAPVRLAIGRANGDIEIWNPLHGRWLQEVVMQGGKDRSIDGLVWVAEPDQIQQDGIKVIGRSRLFSIGYTSAVTEWDLESGRPRKHASGMHGDIWCIGAQPPVAPAKKAPTATSSSATPASRKLVAGTIDGSLVLYSIDNDDLQFNRVLARSSSRKTRIVSIAFQNRNTVVVGCSDSAIRVYDIRNGNILRTMTLGSDLAGGAKDIIVWSVKCLNGGDIVSGDSTGQVCIWDGKTYTQTQRLQAHNQDVLSLTTSPDGATIMSGGMDRKTVLYRKTTGSSARWSKAWHRRYHKHDVKTMASFEGNGLSVVVSGGPDACPIVLPLREAGVENHRTLSHLPQNPLVQSAPRGRMIVSWWDREIRIWRLRRPLRDLVEEPDEESSVGQNRKLLAQILIKGEASITSATINRDGSLLVVSTVSNIKAFYLKPRSVAGKDELKISQVDVHEDISKHGATRVQLSPDGQWLCAIQGASRVTILPILQGSTPDNKPAIHPKAIRLSRIERKIPKHIALGGLGRYDRTITHIAFSPDSQMLAVADLAGYIDTWVLGTPQTKLGNGVDGTHDDTSADDNSSESEDEGEDKSGRGGLRWTRNPRGSLIPKLQAAPTVLSFSGHIPISKPSTGEDEAADDYTLLTVTARPQVLVIHPSLGSLTPWSRRNQISRFPHEFRNTRDLAKGALWSGKRVWLFGNAFLFMLDLGQDLKEPTDTHGSSLVKQGTKRKRGGHSGAGSKMDIGAMGPTKVSRQAGGGKRAENIPLDGPVLNPTDEEETSHPAGESESEDSDDAMQGELAVLRDAQGKLALESQASKGVAFWHTYKYRSILGIVALGEAGREEEGNSNGATGTALNGGRPEPLEVALVERPLWQIDMPDRYFADKEQER